MKKKTFIIFLMITLIVTMVVPAFASNNVDYNYNVEGNSEISLLWQELESRIMEFQPIMPTTEVQLPVDGLESLLLDVPPIDTSHLETEYRYDHLGYRYETFTEEAIEWLFAAITRQAVERITPEFEAYVDAIAAEADFFLAQHDAFMQELIKEMAPDFAKFGVDIQPMYSDDPDIRRVATIFDINDRLTVAQRNSVTSIGRGAVAAAIAAYPVNTARRDAYRHFLWTRRLSVQIGFENARIATNNHEWSYVILNRNGRQGSDAQFVSWRLTARNTANANQAGFDSVFHGGVIQDFWNNRVGAQCFLAGNNINITPELQLFINQINNGNIIQNNSPTANQRSVMRSSGWWRHF